MKRTVRIFVGILNVGWKLGLVALGIAAVFFSIFLVKEWSLEERRGGRPLNGYVTEYDKDGYVSIYNQREGKFTLERLDWVSHGVSEDRIGVYSQNLKRGFFDYTTGKPLTDPIYNKAWNFSEGLGAVETDGKVGFVDTNMILVIPQKFHLTRASDDWPDAIQFHSGQCVLRLKPDSVGVIDTKGNWVIEPIYQSVSDLSLDSCRVVEKEGLFGIVDYKGNFVIEPRYDAVRITDPNVAVVAKDGYQKKITYSGETLLAFVFDDAKEFTPESPKYMEYEVNNCRGVLDKRTGKPVIPAIYESIELLSGDRFLAGLKEVQSPLATPKTSSYILLDSNNRKISERD